MRVRVKGCSVYSEGDDSAFRLVELADEVLTRVENAQPGEWLSFLSMWSNDDGDETQRTLYLRADKIWAIAPFLVDEDAERDDDEDDEAE